VHSLLHQSALKGVEGGAGTGRHADLGIEILDVIVGRFGRDFELAGRFLGGVSGCDQPQDFDLARRQTR